MPIRVEVSATTLPKQVLSHLTQFLLIKSLDSPTAALKIGGVFEKELGSYQQLRAYYEGELVFEGEIDKLSQKIRKGAVEYQIEARDVGSVLLDQEALPAKYQSIDFKGIFTRYILPLGTLKNSIPQEGKLSEFVVSARQSIWDVVENFCIERYHQRPFIYRGRICLKYPCGSKVISNAILSLTKESKPCERIGRVFIRDAYGNYQTQIKNPWGQARKVCYVVGATEWEHAGESANRLIQDGMRKSEQLTAVFDGVALVEPGEKIKFSALGQEVEGYTAFEVVYEANPHLCTRIRAVPTQFL